MSQAQPYLRTYRCWLPPSSRFKKAWILVDAEDEAEVRARYPRATRIDLVRSAGGNDAAA